MQVPRLNLRLRQLFQIFIVEICLGLLTITYNFWKANGSLFLARVIPQLAGSAVLLATGTAGLFVIRQTRASFDASIFLSPAGLNIVVLTLFMEDVGYILQEGLTRVISGQMEWSCQVDMWMYLIFPVITDLLVAGFAFLAVCKTVNYLDDVVDEYQEDIMIRDHLAPNAFPPYTRAVTTDETAAGHTNKQP
ncbi:uncharacterized protein LOC129600422 [Paramacrobiotus metropolitanus]|uniref:uncharacterized protein LOC129600422 n=1 Tax=Paramacrobiotus metropolitanus TaxID=2943436 RepID=UPI002445BBC7|nr:uncharacterized protein LOC129600422 [Paramacrobiotus metropolitanus]